MGIKGKRKRYDPAKVGSATNLAVVVGVMVVAGIVEVVVFFAL